MAGRPGQPGGQPQYSLPKLAPEEQFVQKKQGEYIQADVRQLSMHMDVETAFRDVKDAISRLLPFHLFNSVDASELDLDDTPDHAGANLMSTRHEAWQELCIAKANELRKKADRSAATIAAIEQQMDSEVLSGNRPLDRLAMVKLQQEDLRRKIAVEKAELQKLVVVTQAAAPPAQPTAGAAAPAGMAGKAPVAAAAVQQQVVPNALALQQIQNLQVQMMQRQNLMQQLAQQQQLQGGLQPAQVQQYLLLQQQNQQAQAAMQQALLQQQMLQQAAKKQ